MPEPKFLLDENVKKRLERFLASKEFDARFATLSKAEGRVLVTNDSEFASLPEHRLFAAIWLKIPQDKPEKLLSSFEKLLAEVKEFEGKLIVLREDFWDVHPLGEETKFSSAAAKAP